MLIPSLRLDAWCPVSVRACTLTLTHANIRGMDTKEWQASTFLSLSAHGLADTGTFAARDKAK